MGPIISAGYFGPERGEREKEGEREREMRAFASSAWPSSAGDGPRYHKGRGERRPLWLCTRRAGGLYALIM